MFLGMLMLIINRCKCRRLSTVFEMVNIKNISRVGRENYLGGRGGNPALSRPGEAKSGVINTAQVMF
ncbi:hypothetical protein N9Z76_00185 [bacterium]|nr:hypothetical protein [bacterium]